MYVCYKIMFKAVVYYKIMFKVVGRPPRIYRTDDDATVDDTTLQPLYNTFHYNTILDTVNTTGLSV